MGCPDKQMQLQITNCHGTTKVITSAVFAFQMSKCCCKSEKLASAVCYQQPKFITSVAFGMFQEIAPGITCMRKAIKPNCEMNLASWPSRLPMIRSCYSLSSRDLCARHQELRHVSERMEAVQGRLRLLATCRLHSRR